MTTPSEICRCAWANPKNPRYLAYHDQEWGLPCHDERTLFEMLNLEGAQAGLSWETILNKRAGYANAFADWDAVRIAAFDEDDVTRLLADPGIVRNQLKIRASINNAQAYLRLRESGQTLDSWLWAYVEGQPIDNQLQRGGTIYAKTPLSDRISKDLSRLGFKFVGSTIIYAYLQSMGLVNDHVHDCFRYLEVKESNERATI